MYENNRDFKGVWIPKEIYLHPDLSWSEKILLIEIDSLDNCPNRGCFASNEYLGKFLGISAGSCANMISKLKKLEFLEQCFFDGRNRGLKLHKNMKSAITLPQGNLHKNMKSDFIKTLKQTSQICEHNNTINNTLNNLEERVAENENTLPLLPENLPENSIPLNAFSLPEEKEKNCAKKEKEAAEEVEFNPAAENIKRLQAAENETAPLPTYGIDFAKIAWGDLSNDLKSLLSDFYTQKQGSGSKVGNIAVQRSVATIERVLSTITQHQKIKTAAKAQEVLCSVLDTVITNGYSFSEKMLIEKACKLVENENKTGAVTDIKTAHFDKKSMADAYFKMSQK